MQVYSLAPLGSRETIKSSSRVIRQHVKGLAGWDIDSSVDDAGGRSAAVVWLVAVLRRSQQRKLRSAFTCLSRRNESAIQVEHADFHSGPTFTEVDAARLISRTVCSIVSAYTDRLVLQGFCTLHNHTISSSMTATSHSSLPHMPRLNNQLQSAKKRRCFMQTQLMNCRPLYAIALATSSVVTRRLAVALDLLKVNADIRVDSTSSQHRSRGCDLGLEHMRQSLMGLRSLQSLVSSRRGWAWRRWTTWNSRCSAAISAHKALNRVAAQRAALAALHAVADPTCDDCLVGEFSSETINATVAREDASTNACGIGGTAFSNMGSQIVASCRGVAVGSLSTRIGQAVRRQLRAALRALEQVPAQVIEVPVQVVAMHPNPQYSHLQTDSLAAAPLRPANRTLVGRRLGSAYCWTLPNGRETTGSQEPSAWSHYQYNPWSQHEPQPVAELMSSQPFQLQQEADEFAPTVPGMPAVAPMVPSAHARPQVPVQVEVQASPRSSGMSTRTASPTVASRSSRASSPVPLVEVGHKVSGVQCGQFRGVHVAGSVPPLRPSSRATLSQRTGSLAARQR
eukprot:TRINITY_DN27668_c0_g1_i1.p1 TRINITY_DN27668_c0_g1~~TRINITY_DN27668_c0_g1_i1.p1  ORF type:complete len:567 (+),score=28.01 TRINITY_DN27668_c0_g1_i1:249-1949(+)